MTVVTITGHRPERIENWPVVIEALRTAFKSLDVTYVIQGMAAGVDLKSAWIAYDMGIPYGCAIPWATHEPRLKDRGDYAQAKIHANHVWIVNDCEGYPGPEVYQERNEFMVDRSHLVIAVWDNLKIGGTWNCIEYAVQTGHRIWVIDPRDGVAGWYDG